MSKLKALKVHPAALLFPLLGKAQYGELLEDIKANGMKYPVLVNKEKDTIIDGRTRYMIANDLDLSEKDIPFEVFKGKDEQIVDEIMSRNIHRRHLDPDQRVTIIAKLLGPQFQAEAAADKASGKGTEKKGKGDTAQRVAKAAKTTEHKGRQALEVSKHADLVEEVVAGKTKLGKAAKKAKARKPAAKKKAKTMTLDDEVKKRFLKFMDHWSVEHHRKVKAIIKGLL